ncbi:nucleotidyltransferase family protein [Metallumcola ferriviriculae]|uniref:Nucleotidyltransferase family protein n=1 Tax=Metallumcola ferriviriculae TaxID=3039180 RepID=A0AAU0UKS7_9FIRM|nr:nucleotidyltransferase family protein [Desulfitibacteraceae bacterium MK1]
MDAIILAGSTNSAKLQEASGVAAEGMIEIHNKLMVQYVLEALLASENINSVVVVGLPEVQEYFRDWPEVVLAPAGSTPVKSLINGLKHSDSAGMVLVATDDIPLITTEAVDHFVGQCQDRKADLFYPIINREVHEARYPGSERTYVKLKEGTFTGGNIFLINPNKVPQCAAKVEDFVRLRKKPFELCKLVGVTFLIKFLLRALSITEAESRVSSLLGINGYAVISPYPEVGLDVDKLSDLEMVKNYMTG